MNILILCNSFLPGFKEATKITITEFAEILTQQGHRVEIIPNNSLVQTYKKAKQLKKDNFTPDIIHCFSSAPLLVLKTLLVERLFPKTKTIHTLKSYSKKLLGSLHFARLLNKADLITVSTHATKQALTHHGAKESKIQVIRSPINLDRFVPMNKDVLKKKYRHANKIVLFYYGSLHKNKGSYQLIEACAPILKEDRNTVLITCPRHAVPQELLDHAKSLEIQDQIQWKTHDVDIVEYLNMADVLILPYISMEGTEGNPSCLLEAAACKVPIVTSDFAELREIMKPDVDVLIAPPGNIEKLSEQIQRILGDHKLAKKLTENAYKKKEEYKNTVIADEFVELYKKIKQ
ncbi:glycosyltransferase family 4 protein [Candidatus Woesearchaeota archaeon]|nr:glycosyltransferase family 4 protein [Candidatus Woesearchaeota archaeon]